MVQKRKIFIPLILVFLMLTLVVPIQADLDVHFIDVGQGDAIFLQSSAGTSVLIDGGNRWNRVETKLLSFLQERDVETLDAVVSTHPHADHIGGLSSVLHSFNVSAVYDPGRIHTSKTFEDYLTLIDTMDIPFHTPRRGETIEIGDLTFTVLHPGNNVEDYSLNNSSLVLQLNYGEVDFLFTGDIEREGEAEILRSGLELGAEVLKVSHHGSKTSSQQQFLAALKPKIAVIPVGEDNKFNHPSPELLERLQVQGVEVYRTDRHGDVVVSTDGESYTITSSKDAPPITGTDLDVDEKEEEDTETEKSAGKAGLLNINTASAKALESLWGVGPATAEKIIKYREQQGEFTSSAEIMEVDGIDEKKYEKWQDEITI
ncbi:MAG: MBL fold metallo-hydrolase [Bacillota bacterium]